MTTRWMLAAASAALLTAAAGQAAAQQQIAPESTVYGQLETRDPVSSTGGRFDRWRVYAQPGELIVLTMTSDTIDPYLLIGRAAPGGQFHELARDDDGGGYPTAQLQYRATEGGEYEVRATSFGTDSYGGYALARSSYAPPGSGGGYGSGYLPIDVGGYIDWDDPVDDSGRHYEAYRFELPAQRVVRIRQESPDADSYVTLGVTNDYGEWIPLFYDDDSGGGLDSEFYFQSVADDMFEVRASTYGAGASGSYRLIVEDVSATAEGGMSAGMITGGYISEADNPGEGAFYEYRDFYALAGQQVTVSYRSSEFDPYLEVGRWSGASYVPQWSDDDSGGGESGFDSQVTFVAPYTGLYTAKLTTYSPGEIGLFSFEVQAW